MTDGRRTDTHPVLYKPNFNTEAGYNTGTVAPEVRRPL